MKKKKNDFDNILDAFVMIFVSFSGLGRSSVSISTLVRSFWSKRELLGWSGARVMKVFIFVSPAPFLLTGPAGAKIFKFFNVSPAPLLLAGLAGAKLSTTLNVSSTVPLLTCLVGQAATRMCGTNPPCQ